MHSLPLQILSSGSNTVQKKIEWTRERRVRHPPHYIIKPVASASQLKLAAESFYSSFLERDREGWYVSFLCKCALTTQISHNLDHSASEPSRKDQVVQMVRSLWRWWEGQPCQSILWNGNLQNCRYESKARCTERWLPAIKDRNLISWRYVELHYFLLKFWNDSLDE